MSFKTTEQAEAVNMGISIVVPAKKILEVLYHPELVKMRKKYDDEIAEANAPAADSELGKEMQITAKGLEIPVLTADEFLGILERATRKVEPSKKK